MIPLNYFLEGQYLHFSHKPLHSQRLISNLVSTAEFCLQSDVQIHTLHTSMVDLLRKLLLRFVQPKHLPRKIWKIDPTNKEIWLNHYQFCIGRKAQALLVDLVPSEQADAIEMMNSFFSTAAQKLLFYLPFGNKLLKSTEFLAPEKQYDTEMEKWGLRLAKCMPNVISSAETSTLVLEIRQVQSMKPKHHTPVENVREHWVNIHKTGKYPLMVRLALAICALPHGNSDVERVFSVLHDTLQKKRLNMKPETVTAVLVSKSCMRVKSWTAATMPVTKELVNMALAARAAHMRKREDQQRLEEEMKRKCKQQKIIKELDDSKRTNDVMMLLQKQSKEMEDDIRKKTDERNKIRKLMEDLQTSAQRFDDEIEDLHQKKQIIGEKKEKQTSKIVQNILKRHAINVDLDAEAADAGQKKQKTTLDN